MKIKRLELLAYYLPSIPENEFNIISWTRCSIGWAAKVPEFVKLGFAVYPGFTTLAPQYKSCLGWNAVEKFFGLTPEDAKYLFSMFEYSSRSRVTPKMVAARIKKFVKGVKRS
jgi:hypothetical protein